MPIVRRISPPDSDSGTPLHLDGSSPPRAERESMTAPHTAIERRLWDAADQLRANSKLKSSEYSVPVLGLIFLRYADYRFAQVDQQLKTTPTTSAARATSCCQSSSAVSWM